MNFSFQILYFLVAEFTFIYNFSAEIFLSVCSLWLYFPVKSLNLFLVTACSLIVLICSFQLLGFVRLSFCWLPFLLTVSHSFFHMSHHFLKYILHIVDSLLKLWISVIFFWKLLIFIHTGSTPCYTQNAESAPHLTGISRNLCSVI